MTKVQTALTARINEEHRACEEAARSAVGHAIRCGEMLAEAKSRTAHGQWGSWLRQNFAGSERTAQTYMRVARNREKLNPQRAADLSLRSALRELEPPGEEGEPEPAEPGRKHLTGGLLYLIHRAEMGELEEAASDARVSELEMCRRIHRGLYRAYSEGEVSRGWHWEKAHEMWRLAELCESSAEARSYLYSELLRLDERVTPADLPPSGLREIVSERIRPEERAEVTVAEAIHLGLTSAHRDRLEGSRVAVNIASMGPEEARLLAEIRDHFHPLPVLTVRERRVLAEEDPGLLELVKAGRNAGEEGEE